ncbi:MAG: peptidase T [Schaedlerella sp.]|nr:peptidase T [Schaedlerella sp.]
MRAYERLLNYVVVRTPSDENSTTTPSTSCQFNLAHLLVEELKDLGLSDAHVDDKCYVYAHLPATPGYENKARLGLIAHMDTVIEFCDHEIRPIVTENYDGKPLPLGTSGRILEATDFKVLNTLIGRTLITTDGTTILGADDKAGIAEIMTVLEILITENIPHGPVSIGFTPDEEIGSGADHFNHKEFNADFAYTLDGEAEGSIEYENFNAARVIFEIDGINVHPGAARDTMINAALIGMEINSLLPTGQTPRDTDGYDGFYHLLEFTGDVSHAHLDYIIRDHDNESFNNRKQILRDIEKSMKEKWGENFIHLKIKDEYCNMAEIIKQHIHLIDNAKKACRNLGIEPHISPIRGGTDGARLSYDGLPCPNLGTGAHAVHGPYEFITAEGMDIATQIAVEIVKLYAEIEH